MRRTGLASLAAVAATISVCGCGGRRSLSMTSLHHAATTVCALSVGQSDAIPTPRSPAGGAAFLVRGIAVLAPELGALRRITPPSDEADVYATALAAFDRKLNDLRRTDRALERGHDPVIAIKALQNRLAPVESAEDEAWEALKIPGCLNR